MISNGGVKIRIIIREIGVNAKNDIYNRIEEVPLCASSIWLVLWLSAIR